MGKQSDRREAKKATKAAENEEPVVQTNVGFQELGQTLVMTSVLVQSAPLLPSLLKDGIALVKGEAVEKAEKPKEKEEDKENKDEEPAGDKTDGEKEEKQAEVVPDFILEKDACGTFSKICSRLHFANPLGVGKVTTPEEAIKVWKEIKGLEIDFGPKAKRKGSPGTDRIVSNLCTYAVQYLHVLLGLMILRSFLFRSFFACLPWIVIYQFLSMILPLGKLAEIADSLPAFIPAEKIPFDKVPLEKVPVELRVVATVGFNGLLHIFFLYELFWKTYFIEKLLLGGLVAYHAYAVRPIDA